MPHFNEHLLGFEQAGKGIPVSVSLDTNKRAPVQKAAAYRFVTTGTALYFRFGDSSVTCASNGTEGYLLLPNQEYIFFAPEIQPGETRAFIAFSRAINPTTDNFVQVR